MLKLQCLSCKLWLRAGKKFLNWPTLVLWKIRTKSTKVTVYVLHEFKVANWLSSYCLEPWQTNRYQICGHYISSCILHLFSPHFSPLGRNVCSQDRCRYPRTHLIALQSNACAACSLLLFSHLTKILCLKNSWVEDVVPQPKLLCSSAVVLQEIFAAWFSNTSFRRLWWP